MLQDSRETMNPSNSHELEIYIKSESLRFFLCIKKKKVVSLAAFALAFSPLPSSLKFKKAAEACQNISYLAVISEQRKKKEKKHDDS